MFPGNSLAIKLLSPVLATNLVLAVCFAFCAWHWGQAWAETHLANETQCIASAINYAGESIREIDELQRVVAAIGADKRIQTLAIVNTDTGRVLAANRYAWIDSFFEEVCDTGDLGGTSHTLGRTWFSESGKEVLCVEPFTFAIASNNATPCFVYMVVDSTTTRRSVIVQAWRVFGLSLLGTIVLSCVFLALAQRYILRPIHQLTDAIPENIDSLDKYRNPLQCNDEYSTLANALESAYSKLNQALLDEQAKAEQLRSTGELARVGSWRLDLSKDYVEWCPQTRRMHGVSADARIDVDTAIGFYYPEVREIVQKSLARAISEAAPFDFELPLRTAQGQEKWMRVAGCPVVEQGAVVAVHGAIQDITAYTALSEATFESERRQRLISECAGLGTWDWTLSNNRLIMNERWYEMLGYEANEVESTYEFWEKLIHPQDLPLTRKQLHDHFHDPRIPLRIEHRLRNFAGEWTWVVTAGRVYERDEAGNPLRMAGVNFDITDRKESEARLTRLQRQNELIVDTVLNPIITLDGNNCITGWNKQSKDLLEYDIEDVLGKEFAVTLLNGTSANAHVVFGKTHEGVAVSKLGREIPIEYTITPLDLDDEPSFVVVMTDASRKHEEIHHQKLESIGLLAAGIAHEINTPMQFIGDNTDYLDVATKKLVAMIRGISDDFRNAMYDSLDQVRTNWDNWFARIKFEKIENNISAAIEDSKNGIERVTEIVSAMREFSHPGSAKMEEVDINQSIRNTIVICRNRTKYAAEVELSLADDLPKIVGHPTDLSQAFLNLIVNAVDAITERFGNQKEGLIRVRSCRVNDEIHISIADNGVGMSDSVKYRIFDPFFTTKKLGEGTGQGLTYCYNTITKTHGGKITVQTRTGHGSTFEIVLPIRCDLADNECLKGSSGTSASSISLNFGTSSTQFLENA